MPGVDLSSSLYAQYRKARSRAEKAEKNGDYQRASISYGQAAGLMSLLSEKTKEKTIQEMRIQRSRDLKKLSNQLNLASSDHHNSISSEILKTRVEGEENSALLDDVMSMVEKSTVAWGDIAGLTNTKNEIKLAYALGLAKKPSGVILNTTSNFLLYGPPGNGKTLLAAATAGSLDATFFNAKLSNIISKFVGESSKLISALYEAANTNSPSVVFLDEFDAIATTRGMGETNSEKRILSSLLTEIDGVGSKKMNNLVITIAATNHPWSMDPAILSRFQKKIYVGLPDKFGREGILKNEIIKNGYVTEVSFEKLAKLTRGYSGREIKYVCNTAVEIMTMENNKNLLKAVDMGAKFANEYELKFDLLTLSHFQKALEKIRASISDNEINRYLSWTQK